MSQEQTALNPKEVFDFLKSKGIDIETELKNHFKVEFISEKKRDLFLKIICDRKANDLQKLMHSSSQNNALLKDMKLSIIRYCNEFVLESRNQKKKKLKEVKSVLQSTKNILDQLNLIMNQNQPNETQNSSQNPIESDEFSKIEKSIKNLDEISPYGKNKETKKLVQDLYTSLEQLNMNINTKE